LQCRNQECRVSETGKCVEGLALDKCPHFGLAPSTVAEPTTSEENAAVAVLYEVSLEKADRLDIQGASAVLRAAPTHLIAIIGPTSSGKTSLIASLCDLFQQGRVGDISFARSRTFFAFEEACHHSRAASLRNVPQMEHTTLGSGVGFYHLALRDGGTPDLVNVLFADRSGEDYRSAADDPSNAASFVEVRRADCITILVTGEGLLDIALRHNVRQDIVMILQGLIDGGVTSLTQRVALVLTKLDLIQRADGVARARAERDFDDIVARVEALFGSLFAEIRSFKIAAAPATAVLSHGYGVSDVLHFWIAPWSPSLARDMRLPRAKRAMSRFGILEPGAES
jgi:energy-coupling factor transporter ATP-binding protein EcfA2